MAHVPTILSGAVGEKSMGKPAPNKPDDVKKIQALLKKAFGSGTLALKDGVCDAAMKGLIADFQRLWGGTPDSTVDPGGRTLKRFDRIVNPLELKPISLAWVLERTKNGKVTSDGGGYTIAYRTCDGGELPSAASGYTQHLTVVNDLNSLDVTGCNANDLMNTGNLGALLTILDKQSAWATPVQCRIQLRYKGTVISTSAAQTLQAPIQPHNGKMLPLDEVNNGAKLTYQGDAVADSFYGRMFVQVEGFAKLPFVYAGRFETKTEHRGFDCITYAGTTCGASNFHMADSADLASSLGATVVTLAKTVKDAKTGKESTSTIELDKANPDDVKAFFAANSTGYFLMWSGGHIVIVADGTVNEFKASAPSGYAQTAVATWLEPYKTKKLTVRRLPSKPARAT